MCFTVIDKGLNPMSGQREYKVLFDEREAAALRLDAFDSAVVNSPINSIADLFQTWERIAFRWAQQYPTPATEKKKQEHAHE